MENSIERVINTSIGQVINLDNEDANINFNDWHHLKWPVVSVWNNLRDAIFRIRNNMEPAAEPYLINGRDV
jgi:hypothetical protein